MERPTEGGPATDAAQRWAPARSALPAEEIEAIRRRAAAAGEPARPAERLVASTGRLVIAGRQLTESAVVLVLVNLLPLAGVLFLGWGLQTVLALYWLESGIVGLLNVPRILLAAGPLRAGTGLVRVELPVALGVGKLVMVPFFLMHYGIFWLVHGVFVFVALPAFAGGLERLPPGALPALPGGLDGLAVVVTAGALFVSHLVSFLVNYVGRGEYRTVSPMDQMQAPYARVVVLHLTILFGAFGIAMLGTPLAPLLVMVVVKTVIDLGLHLREHDRARQRATGAVSAAPRPPAA
ncbi:MAG TPA: DUF6498-containing protein [Candidatus Limnocylindrales bacterium]|nr:DUF6498-containing protein [Candidatus Limnocylindrales bacterium]